MAVASCWEPMICRSEQENFVNPHLLWNRHLPGSYSKHNHNYVHNYASKNALNCLVCSSDFTSTEKQHTVVLVKIVIVFSVRFIYFVCPIIWADSQIWINKVLPCCAVVFAWQMPRSRLRETISPPHLHNLTRRL